VPVNTVIERPRELRTLRLRVGGIAMDQVPTDAEQSWSGDVLRITRPAVERLGSYVLPYPAKGEQAAALVSTPFVPSGHPRLQSLVREIVGSETDARAVVGRLNQWVYGYLRKVPTLSIPNALQVLDAGQGDCNEHATLLAALSRTAGVPTRLVAGAVYQDGAFYYHAWCEVWMDRWVSVDPTFGQFPADATHLKLVQGGPERYLDLLRVIGRLELTILPEQATSRMRPSLQRDARTLPLFGCAC
jgi:transglutaminase-like putative cysteine protease